MKTNSPFLATLRYAFQDFIRDRFGLIITLLMPVIFVASFALPTLLLSGDASKMRVVLVQPATMAPKFETFVDQLKTNKRFIFEAADRDTGTAKLRSRAADHMIIVPDQPGSRILVISSDPLKSISPAALLEAGLKGSHLEIDPDLVAEIKPLDEHQRSPVLEFLPVVLTFLIFFQCVLGATNSIVAAKEKGLLRHLLLTPVSMGQFISAGIIIRMGAGLYQVLFILVPAVAFGLVPLDPALLGVIGFSALFLFAMLSLGFLMAGLIPTVSVSGQITTPIMLVFFYLGGAAPGFERAGPVTMISPFLPVRYFVDGVKQCLLGQTGNQPLAVDALALIGFTILFIVIGARTFKMESSKR